VPSVAVRPVVGVVIVGAATTVIVKGFVETVMSLTRSVNWTAMPLKLLTEVSGPVIVPFEVLKFAPGGNVPEKL
jgi:hypothetical protein